MKKIFPNIGIGTFLLEGDDSYESVLTALKVGYRLIDTAAVYQNEREVGKAITASKIDRRDIFISTKLFAKKNGYATAIEECRESIQKLAVDDLDIYFIHWMPRAYEELLDTWRGFEYLYEQGLCKAIGVCNISLYYLDKLLQDAKIPPMYCQIEFHPFLQQDIFLTYCRKHHIQVIGYGLFAKGKVFQDERLKQLALQNNTTIANLVISWAQTQGVIPLIKSKTKTRIETNFLNNFKLTAELLSDIRTLNDGMRVYRDPENNPYV